MWAMPIQSSAPSLVVFADVRASTALGEQSDATTFAERLNEFYGTATKVLIHNVGSCGQADWRRSDGSFIQGIAGRISTQGSDCRARTGLERSPSHPSVSLPTQESHSLATWDRAAYWISPRWVTSSMSVLAFRPMRPQARLCLQLRFTR